MSCRLIINADDYGWSEGANEAICTLFDLGVVTSTSLMMGAPAAADALNRLRTRPGLAVGLHMVMVYGPALLPREQIPHLVDARGWFSMNPTVAGLRYTFLPACQRELRRELEAQFAAFAKTGLQWSHIDSHLHFSLTPVFFRTALEIARKYPVVGFRVPEDDFELYSRMEPEDAAGQKVLAWWFAQSCPKQRREAQKRGYTLTQHCYGLFRTGRLNAEYLARLTRALPDGDHELHCHPDLSTEAGENEFNALRSAEFRDALTERGVELATYASLTRDTRT